MTLLLSSAPAGRCLSLRVHADKRIQLMLLLPGSFSLEEVEIIF